MASSEASRLKIITRAFINWSRDERVIVGVTQMDDAAVLNIPPGMQLVVSSDFTRGSGFDLFQAGHITYEDIGYYNIIANLSDLAAMGAKPLALTTIVRYPPNLTDTNFHSIINGIKLASEQYNTPVVGGDIGNYSSLVLSATAFGTVEANKSFLRSTAKTGWSLYLAGQTGIAISAQIYFLKLKPKGKILDSKDENNLLTAWKKPTPRIYEALILQKNSLGCCAIDTSDGLSTSVRQLSFNSRVSFNLKERDIPVAPVVKKVALLAQIDPMDLIFSNSPDFCLLFAVSSSKQRIVDALIKQNTIKAKRIGIATHLKINLLSKKDGSVIELPGQSWDQTEYTYLDKLLSQV